jgi:hypothetical protein
MFVVVGRLLERHSWEAPSLMLLLLLGRQTLHRPQFESRDSLHSMLNSVQATVVAVPVLSVYSLRYFAISQLNVPERGVYTGLKELF